MRLKKVPSSYQRAYPDYLDPKLKRKENIWRLDPDRTGYDDRFYVEWIEDAPSNIYLSLTSAITALIPKGYGFYRWVAQTGGRSKEIAAMTAIFGSVFHGEVLKPLISKSGYDLSALNDIVDQERGWDRFSMLFPIEYRDMSKKWKYAFFTGALSFWKFVNDRVTRVYAIELPLVSRKWNYAGTLDLVCELKFNRKDVLAIVDLKSKLNYTFSREGETKAYYPEHRAQLAMQKKLLVENYPKLVKKYGGPDNIYLFNWNSINWKVKKGEVYEDGEVELVGGPNYDLVNHTGPDNNEFEKTVPFPGRRGEILVMDLKLATLPAMETAKPKTQVTEFSGEFPSVDLFDWRDHVELLDI